MDQGVALKNNVTIGMGKASRNIEYVHKHNGS